MSERKNSLPDSGFKQTIDDHLERQDSIPELKKGKLTPYEESLKLAQELLTRYDTQIKEQLGKDIDGWSKGRSIFTDFQDSIKYYMDTIPEDIKEHYCGHGIKRRSFLEQFAGALNIMANKSIKGEYGPLVVKHPHEAYAKAYTKGVDFFILSRHDQPLGKKDDHGQQIFNEAGWEADIGAVVVNTKYYALVEEFKTLFPDVNIIKANELEKYLKINAKKD